jgi:hypothetical protein
MRRALVYVAAAVLVLGCSSGSADCDNTEAIDCPDLEFKKVGYEEWREANQPPIREELGDARYPACNAGPCVKDPFDGLQGTDVWNIKGVDNRKAVLGLRQGTQTYVVFVAQGVDPESLLPSIDPDLLAGD